MVVNVSNEVLAEQQVYLATDIQRILGIGRSKAYEFLEEVHKQKNPPFRVLKIGKLLRVPKSGFDAWLNSST